MVARKAMVWPDAEEFLSFGFPISGRVIDLLEGVIDRTHGS